MSANAAKLSRLQKEILLRMLSFEEEVGRASWGIPLPWLRAGDAKTPADSAAFSRALVRLDRRGLLIRSASPIELHDFAKGGGGRPSKPPRRRTEGVVFTADGREVAKRLTSGNVARC